MTWSSFFMFITSQRMYFCSQSIKKSYWLQVRQYTKSRPEVYFTSVLLTPGEGLWPHLHDRDDSQEWEEECCCIIPSEGKTHQWFKMLLDTDVKRPPGFVSQSMTDFLLMYSQQMLTNLLRFINSRSIPALFINNVWKTKGHRSRPSITSLVLYIWALLVITSHRPSWFYAKCYIMNL